MTHLVKYWTGRKLSKEHIIKLKKAKNGIRPSMECYEGLRAFWKNPKISKLARIKMSLAKQGSNHYNWKDGISKKPFYNKWIKCKRRKQGGLLTIKTVQRVYEDNIKKYGTLTCYLCEESILFGNDSLEHKIPLSRGGTNVYKNLDVACCDCNYKKHTKTDKEFKKILNK